jgi:hypothetical protein
MTMRAPLPLLYAVLGLAFGWRQVAVPAADGPAGDRPARVSAGAVQLTPTATCSQEAVDELNKTIEFVRGQMWAEQPGSIALNIAPDLNECRVVLHVGHLSDKEQAALRAGAGSRLAIEYRRDWARPSRVLLTLWIIFGGSGVVWVYWRYARR